MYQAPLPSEYADLPADETRARIRAAKAALGNRCVILGHHYQRDEIIEHADFRGDSYKLCLDASKSPEAEFIVFCGVHFMAESADILTDKRVILPNLAAGCSMADMANVFQVKSCWKQLEEVLRSPLAPGRGEGVGGGGRPALNNTGPNIGGSAPHPGAQTSPTLSPSGGEGESISTPDGNRTNLEGSAPHPVPQGGTTLSPSGGEGCRVIPVTYINSAANLKGFVGEKGGTVCTSTNAPVAVEWALSQGDKVLFFPDQHLGRNTAVKLGYDPERDMIVWDPFRPLGGNTAEDIKRATFILWKGHCSVHKRFTVEQVQEARAKYPGIKVLVHPECELEVVKASDLYGSTEFIINTVRAAPAGSAWAIGTEINLVSRLAKEMPDKTIFCLDDQICPCSTMYRIHPSFLLWALENLVAGNVVNEIVVPEKTKLFARVALDRMIALAPGTKPKD